MSRRTSSPLQAPDRAAQFAPYILAVLALSGTVFLGSCGRNADAQQNVAADSAVPVRVTALSGADRPAASTISVTGTLAGKEEVALAFKIGGVISRITVDPGHQVRAGQVLAELRPTEIAAQVANAQEGRRKAERDLERVTRLYGDSVATLEQLQDARTALEVASNGSRIAQFNADYAVIRSPGDGIVLSRTAEPGQVVEAGRSVIAVRRNGRGMVVRIGLPDRDAVRVKIGDAADVTFDALAGQHFTARVTQRAATATSGSGDYAVEVTLPHSANSLPTGLVARVTLRTAGDAVASAAASRVLVPLDALVDADGDSAAVFVLHADGRSVSRRALRLTDVAEALHTAQVPVVRGLDGTEKVVTAGMSRLVDGTKVRVITTPTQRAESDAAPTWKAAP
ncbi:MAG: efflux RND transporter periplasmic adaptor subunit [Gemmatimonadaceae bacterium]|nr:efflux RND transporter periplasmic adaptor subunit [Gemmatimonadaceae bacterium]